MSSANFKPKRTAATSRGYIDVNILDVYIPSKIVLAAEFRSSDIRDFLPFGKSISKNFWNPEPAPRHPRSRGWEPLDTPKSGLLRRYKPGPQSAPVNNSIFVPIACTVSEIRRLIGWKLRIFPTRRSFNALDRGEPFRISGWTFYPDKSQGYLSVKISWS